MHGFPITGERFSFRLCIQPGVEYSKSWIESHSEKLCLYLYFYLDNTYPKYTARNEGLKYLSDLNINASFMYNSMIDHNNYIKKRPM